MKSLRATDFWQPGEQSIFKFFSPVTHAPLLRHDKAIQTDYELLFYHCYLFLVSLLAFTKSISDNQHLFIVLTTSF